MNSSESDSIVYASFPFPEKLEQELEKVYNLNVWQPEMKVPEDKNLYYKMALRRINITAIRYLLHNGGIVDEGETVPHFLNRFIDRIETTTLWDVVKLNISQPGNLPYPIQIGMMLETSSLFPQIFVASGALNAFSLSPAFTRLNRFHQTDKGPYTHLDDPIIGIKMDSYHIRSFDNIMGHFIARQDSYY